MRMSPPLIQSNSSINSPEDAHDSISHTIEQYSVANTFSITSILTEQMLRTIHVFHISIQVSLF